MQSHFLSGEIKKLEERSDIAQTALEPPPTSDVTQISRKQVTVFSVP